MEVLLEEGGLVGVKILHDGSIDALLESNAFSRDSLLLGTLGEECLGISLLGDSVADKGLVGDLGNIDTSDRDLGGGGESVDLVDALKRNAVDLVGGRRRGGGRTRAA